MNPIQPRGLDLDWYAFDIKGRCGHFTSGGSDLVPDIVLKDLEIYKKINDYFLGLPLRGSPTLVGIENGDMTSWIERAARGLYSYDYNMDYSGPYDLLYVPSAALYRVEMDQNIASMLPVLPNVDFSKQTEIAKV